MRRRSFVVSTLATAAAIVSGQLNAGERSGGVAGAGGADITHHNIQDTINYGAVSGIRGYAIGSWTCNMGDLSLSWISSGTPGLAMNAYRLHDGRLEQIGQSWVKHACCVVNGSGCGLVCSSSGFGLRPGCRDVYSASFNGGQGRLGPRSGINPFLGTFSPLTGSATSVIDRRLQIPQTDLVTASFPGALYFVEGVYVCTEDAQAGNWANNATYRQVNVDGSFNLNVTGSAAVGSPALQAWRDHGLGLGVPDPSVQLTIVNVPGEGRFHVGSKAQSLGGNLWRYTYAVFNLNSHRSGGALSVPVPTGATVTNVGFRDVLYHSGEPYDNTDWSATVGGGSVTWSSPQAFADNPNSNALRWGTTYTFWFDADKPPSDGQGTLGLFRPGTPSSVLVPVRVPKTSADMDGDSDVDGNDLAIVLGAWGGCPPVGGCPSDLNGDGIINGFDVAILLGDWTGAL